jgi:6,7-dimethyl-8-ribityllumazine synthase
MQNESHIPHSAAGLRVVIIVSQYHEDITSVLEEGAAAAFIEAGGQAESLTKVTSPGAFELPLLCQSWAGRDDVDAVVALGCIIKGQTMHDEHIARAVAQGIMDVQLHTGTPITFGVLTCPSHEHAQARAGGCHGNKGRESMHAAIASARTIQMETARS